LARLLSSSMRNDLRYQRLRLLRHLPFPAAEALAPTGDLEAIGARLYETRARLMSSAPGPDDNLQPAQRPRLRRPRDSSPSVASTKTSTAQSSPPTPGPTSPSPPTKPPHPRHPRRPGSFEDEIIDRLFALNTTRAELGETPRRQQTSHKPRQESSPQAPETCRR